MLILRIKQAECALADGRLDEAFELVQAEEVRRHRRGQRLAGRLARALAQRGQTHLSAQRLQQALADCNKADKLGGNLPETAELRSAICLAMEQRHKKSRQRSLKLAKAKERIEEGWVSVGEQMLADTAGDGSQADALLKEAAAKRLEIEAVAGKAERALGRDDLEAAIDIVANCRVKHKQNDEIAALIARIRSLAKEQISKSLAQGRLEKACSIMERVLPLSGESSDMKELSVAISQCRKAAECIARGQPRRAVEAIKKVKAILPSAGWVEAAIKEAQNATESLEALRTGPLGVSICDSWSAAHSGLEADSTAGLSESSVKQTPMVGKGAFGDRSGSAVPSKFVLQVDGVGSFLVLRDKAITIGPISSSERPVLCLLADPHLPVATIERTDEDYFVRSKEPVYVNEKPVTRRLLGDGDRIGLSSRCRIKFHLPNAASTTAVLTLSGARLARVDINQIILMDRNILMGPGFNYHIRTGQDGQTVTLLVRDGRLLCKAAEKLTVNGQAFDWRAGLPMETPIKIGDISLVLARVKE